MRVSKQSSGFQPKRFNLKPDPMLGIDSENDETRIPTFVPVGRLRPNESLFDSLQISSLRGIHLLARANVRSCLSL